METKNTTFNIPNTRELQHRETLDCVDDELLSRYAAYNVVVDKSFVEDLREKGISETIQEEEHQFEQWQSRYPNQRWLLTCQITNDLRQETLVKEATQQLQQNSTRPILYAHNHEPSARSIIEQHEKEEILSVPAKYYLRDPREFSRILELAEENFDALIVEWSRAEDTWQGLRIASEVLDIPVGVAHIDFKWGTDCFYKEVIYRGLDFGITRRYTGGGGSEGTYFLNSDLTFVPAEEMKEGLHQYEGTTRLDLVEALSEDEVNSLSYWDRIYQVNEYKRRLEARELMSG